MPQESWSSTVVWFEFVIYRAERTTNEGSTMHWLNAAKSRSEIRRRRHEGVAVGCTVSVVVGSYLARATPPGQVCRAL